MKTINAPRLNRRLVLKGLGGAALTLPLLEAFQPRAAHAQSVDDSFAIFFRQANGCAQQNGDEPERFFPRTLGTLDAANVADRATGELGDYLGKLLILKNVNYGNFDWGDGHAAGVLHSLTARGPIVDGAGGDAEAAGESLDHRIGRELNADGRESLVMFAGQNGGWLNGACLSYRSSGVRRSALTNPFNAYQTVIGSGGGLSPEALERLQKRNQSVNDLVRSQLQRLLSRPQLSAADRSRLDLHLSSVRDLEVQLGCRMSEDDERALEGAAPGFDSSDGDETLETARLHMDVAALAVACGQTRAVSIQVGVGNDGFTRYRNLDSGALMENYHFISHRRTSHGSDGAIIPDAARLHHFVDVQFARTFKHLLDKLSSFPGVRGGTLLDSGIACWMNDNANGPPHSISNVPWIIAGSAGGFLKQGQYLEIASGDRTANHARLLNTLGSAVGLRKADGSFIDDHGDPGLSKAFLTELRS